MTKTQKIIKYFAVAFAILLIVGIFYTILGITSNIFGFTIGTSEELKYKVTEVKNEVEVLDIEIKESKLSFKSGDTFKVEASEDVTVNVSNKKLKVREKSRWFNNTNEEIIIYIPSDKYFREVSVEAGSGKIDIESITTNELDFELGAGSININNLNVSSKAQIDAGAGALYLENGIINNLDLDMGVGKAVLNTRLVGVSDIDAGIGELEINLTDIIDNYSFSIDKGIGSIFINGEEVNNRYVSGTSSNKIDIDGGIGSIRINTLEK